MSESKSESKPDKKPHRVSARLPRGFADRGPAELAATRDMLDTIRKVYERYGFEAVETPAFEYTDALGKFLPDQDRPNEGVFSLQDDDEQWLSLRYDLTAPLARFVAENFDRLPKPYRSYRAGWVFRNEKPGPGRFRQFMQFDADTVGSGSVAADAEICMMAADTLEALGIARGDYVIKVNNRKVLDGVMEAIGLAGDENAGRRLTVLRAIDKLDRLGVEGVRLLLGPGRKDDSGDFTKGAGLNEEQVQRLLLFTGWGEPTGAERAVSVNKLRLDSFERAVGESSSGLAGHAELVELREYCKCSGYDDRIIIDPSVVRGLEYYTGPVFEAELTFEIPGDDGKPVRFGSVGGGGRYDGLVSRFRGEKVPATGFSIGVSRLAAALQKLGKLASAEPVGPVVVVPRTAALAPHCMRLVQQLRDDESLRALPGFAAEMYLGGGSFKGGLRYADKRRCVVAIMIGESEIEAGKAVVKDLIEGTEQAKAIETNAEYRAQRLAQFEATEAELPAAIREILARHSA
ncbi:histidine--tRNA ligase [Blastochloris tepida]|uniref:Histidine--tRNA ligase n=1 Tax=Blastochloris tepida TaxID=2233851 RepID=A0A348FVY6_9HYPH|nr:histidine--tRNA ligase [Blastochloris tepida]BBF91469.1 histidine--tRNA ligase [Blastochloris tepida]